MPCASSTCRSADERRRDAAWSYCRTIARADALCDLIGFAARLVQVTEHAARDPSGA